MAKEVLEERLNYYNNLIPPVFQKTLPTNFKLMPSDWILDSKTVNRKSIKIINGNNEIYVRAIGTLDLEILSNDIVLKARNEDLDLVTNYPCGLKCPGCFSEESIFSDSKHLLLWQEVMEIIDVARTIGLHSVKFLGPGELFQNPDLFEILTAFEDRKIPISIFTKGAELGDDELARKNFSFLRIKSAKDLVKRISDFRMVRILLGFNSFFSTRQNSMVGSNVNSTSYQIEDGVFSLRGIANYTEKRNRALVNLVNAGFNCPSLGQRLSLIMAPILRNQIDEVADMYEWAARRNMPLIIAPSMESGPKSRSLVEKVIKLDTENKWIKDIYIKIYERAFSIGIKSKEDLLKSGLSAYIGSEGCNQVANGLMIRLNGQVKICPGSSKPQHIYGKLYDEKGNFAPHKLIDIWLNSPNYRLGPLTNNWCPAKNTMLPASLREEVLESLGIDETLVSSTF